MLIFTPLFYLPTVWNAIRFNKKYHATVGFVDGSQMKGFMFRNCCATKEVFSDTRKQFLTKKRYLFKKVPTPNPYKTPLQAQKLKNELKGNFFWDTLYIWDPSINPNATATLCKHFLNKQCENINTKPSYYWDWTLDCVFFWILSACGIFCDCDAIMVNVFVDNILSQKNWRTSYICKW